LVQAIHGIAVAAFDRRGLRRPVPAMSQTEAAPEAGRARPLIVIVAAAAAVAAVVAAAAVVTGTMDSTNATLVRMGFDADRAHLIAALVIGAVAAAAAALVTDRATPPTLAGLCVVWALFGSTLVRQTQDALKATGANGSFDLTGWLLTTLALATSGLISGWVGATLILAIRPKLAEAAGNVGAAVLSRRLARAHLRSPIAVVLVAILLAVSVPVFGDMVNYTTDARMLHGAPPKVGLAGGEVAPKAAGTTSTQQPWRSWMPTGGGSIYEADLPAPWKNKSSATERIDIYAPPGYDPQGKLRYPVLYEAPFPYDLWDKSINIGVALDSLIDSGKIPPVIVVFVNDFNFPILDTECADSVDGTQWMDKFISSTVVSYMDSNYLTITKATARATTGFSEGGYCAAILALRHPTVFGTSIPFSAYFFAGEGNPESGRPFAGSPSALAEASPMILASQLTAAERAMLYFIVIAQPSQPLYGTEATEFERLLLAENYQFVGLNAGVPHGWDQVRGELPAALEAWAVHMAAVKVFSNPH
jgi:hypothetical protein